MEELFFLNESILRHENVIIYGAGEAGKSVLLELLQRDVRVMCFTDSDPKKCGTRLLNIPIIHIGELSDEYERSAVIVSGIYAFEVAAELEKLGFKHIFYDYGNKADIVHLKREEE